MTAKPDDTADNSGCLVFFGVVFIGLGVGHIWSGAYGLLAMGVALLVVFAMLLAWRY